MNSSPLLAPPRLSFHRRKIPTTRVPPGPGSACGGRGGSRRPARVRGGGTGCQPQKRQEGRAELGATATTEGTVPVKRRARRLSVKRPATAWAGENARSLSLRKPWRPCGRAARSPGVRAEGAAGTPAVCFRGGRALGVGDRAAGESPRALACYPPGAGAVVWPPAWAWAAGRGCGPPGPQ